MSKTSSAGAKKKTNSRMGSGASQKDPLKSKRDNSSVFNSTLSSAGTAPIGKTNLKHYENTPMQYTAIFHSCENDNFQLIHFDHFHIFAQNIYCGYTLEPPH